MNKRILYISLSILTVFLLIFLITNNGGIVSVGQTGIQLSDTTSVSRIEIYGKDTIVLNRIKPDQWILNTGYRTNKVSISNFLYSFQNMSVKGVSYNLDISDTASVRIKIYTGKKKLFFRFYPANGESLLHREGSKKIYSVEVSGPREANLAEVFSDDQDHWRDRTIIDLLPDEISFVKVEHPCNPERNFVIRMEDKNPVLYDSDGSSKIPEELVDNEELLMYVSYFMNIFFDYSIKGKNPEGMSFAESPEYIITIISASGETTGISVFPMYTSKGEDIYNVGLKVNNNSKMLVTRYIVIDLVLRNKKDFFKN